MSLFKFIVLLTHPLPAAGRQARSTFDRAHVEVSLCPSFHEATVYTQLFETEMMNNRQTTGLKGQIIIAQGFDVSSVERQTKCRPGLESEQENRLGYYLHKRENLISDEGDDHLFPENDVLQSRPREIYCFVHQFLTDGFSSASLYPGRRFGSCLPQLCPGLNYIGLSGRKNMHALSCAE